MGMGTIFFAYKNLIPVNSNQVQSSSFNAFARTFASFPDSKGIFSFLSNGGGGVFNMVVDVVSDLRSSKTRCNKIMLARKRRHLSMQDIADRATA